MRARGARRGGPTPYGYRMDAHGGLVPDPREAPVRLLLTQLFLEHRRARSVAAVLSERGHRTRGGAPFSDSTVKRLVAQRAPGIVPDELHRECSTLLGDRALGKVPGKRSDHLFTGMIEHLCGKRMRVPSERPTKYVCAPCRVKIAESDLEYVVRSQLPRLALTTDEADLFRVLGNRVNVEGGVSHLNLSTLWLSLTRTEKRGLLEGLVDCIVVRDGTIEIRHYDLVHSLTSGNIAQGQRMVAPTLAAPAEDQAPPAHPPPHRGARRPRSGASPSATLAFQAIPPEDASLTLLTRKQLRRLVPVSDMTIWRWTREGTFPEPIRQHGRTYWRASDVQAWIEARSGERQPR